MCSHVAVEIGLWACCGLFLGCAAWQDPIAQPKTIKLGDMTFGLELSVGPLGLLAAACHVLRVVLILVTGGYGDSNCQASSIIPLLTSKSQKNAPIHEFVRSNGQIAGGHPPRGGCLPACLLPWRHPRIGSISGG